MGFLAAAIGSAVGLGNIWRFPYVAGENGGATFLIPYVIAIVLCGLPLMMFELAAGRQYRQGILGTVQAMRPGSWLIGVGVGLIGFIILSYYLVVTGWTLGYLVSTPLGQDGSFTAFSASWRPVIFFFVSAGISFTVVMLGVNRGIEAASKALLPILGGVVIFLAGYGFTLPGSDEALAFMFRPHLSELLNAQVWASAFGQAFFSLGVGIGVLITYGSYLDGRGNILGLATVVTGVDTLIALLAGLIIFPLVFSFGYLPEAGPQLAFETLPNVFQQMKLGTLVGTAFYLMLFVAATTSAVALFEMVVTVVSERLGWRRSRSAWLLLLPLLTLGGLSALSYSPLNLRLLGEPVLDILDASVGTFGLLIGGLLTSVALFWFGSPDMLARQLGNSPGAWIGRLALFLGRFVLPAALISTLVAFTVSKL